MTTSGAVGFVPEPEPAPPVNAVYVLPSKIAASLTPSAIAIFSVPVQLYTVKVYRSALVRLVTKFVHPEPELVATFAPLAATTLSWNIATPSMPPDPDI